MSNESEKTKIVVIDDEEGLLTLLKRGLMRPGRFDVAITSNPLEAETLCREFEPDILLLDVVMPQRNGPEIVRSFKNDPCLKKITIIIMSGLGEMVYFEKKDKWRWLPNTPIAKFRGEEVITDDSVYWKVANKYGVDDYIQKPVYVDDLIKIIDLNIEKRSKKGQIDDDLYFLGPSSGS